MKYVVEVGGERHEVELGPAGARYDGETIDTHLADVAGTPVRQVRIGREVHRVVARAGTCSGSTGTGTRPRRSTNGRGRSAT